MNKLSSYEINQSTRLVMIVCLALMGLTLIHGATTTYQLNSSGETVTGTVYNRAMNYYSINVDSVSSMTVQFTNTYSSSSVKVYVKANQPPTISDYDSVITYPGVTKTIITLKNSTSYQSYYFGVYGDGNSYNYYSLTVDVINVNTIANWIIGVIVAAVVITIICAVIAVLLPILVCCGVISCGVCCGAATGAAAGSAVGGNNGSYQQIHTNHVHHHSVSQPIVQPQQQPIYYSGQPQQQPQYQQPTQYYTQPTTYQKV